MSTDNTYTDLERPYGAHLERDASLVVSLGAQPGTGGTSQSEAVKNAGAIGDLWIHNFIRSNNWSPKTTGFYINGLTGYAEFSNVYVSGQIEATTGSIGGWTIASSELYSGNVHLDATNQQIRMGSATGPTTGTGVFIGLSGGLYQFRAGNMAGAYMLWNGSSMTMANAGVTAATITGGTITGSLFRTATTGERIEIDTTNINQIRFYDSSTLYGSLEVDKVGTDGYIRLWAYDEGAGLKIDTGIGASGFNSAELFSNGGTLYTNGSASNGYIGLIAKNGGVFFVEGGPSGDILYTDIPFDSDILPNIDGAYNLGSSSKKWSTIYAYTVNGLTALTVSGSANISSLIVNSANIVRTYSAYVSGTSLSKQSTGGVFTASNPATGRYVLTHNWGSSNYTVQATAYRTTGAGAYSAKVSDLSLNSFEVTIFDHAGTAVTSDFMFVVYRN